MEENLARQLQDATPELWVGTRRLGRGPCLAVFAPGQGVPGSIAILVSDAGQACSMLIRLAQGLALSMNLTPMQRDLVLMGVAGALAGPPHQVPPVGPGAGRVAVELTPPEGGEAKKKEGTAGIGALRDAEGDRVVTFFAARVSETVVLLRHLVAQAAQIISRLASEGREDPERAAAAAKAALLRDITNAVLVPEAFAGKQA